MRRPSLHNDTPIKMCHFLTTMLTSTQSSEPVIIYVKIYCSAVKWDHNQWHYDERQPIGKNWINCSLRKDFCRARLHTRYTFRSAQDYKCTHRIMSFYNRTSNEVRTFEIKKILYTPLTPFSHLSLNCAPAENNSWQKYGVSLVQTLLSIIYLLSTCAHSKNNS